MPEFLKVKRAAVVLDPNDRNELNIELDESFPIYDEKHAKIIHDEYGGYMYYLEDRGFVHYGCYDADGKFWSSRPSVFREHGDNPIEVSFVIPNEFTGFNRRAGAITETFCKKILEDFNLQFHIEPVRPFPSSEIVSILMQNNPPAGEIFTDSQGDEWKVGRNPIALGLYDVNHYFCRKDPYIYSGITTHKNISIREMPREFYAGLYWDEFRALYPSKF